MAAQERKTLHGFAVKVKAEQQSPATDETERVTRIGPDAETAHARHARALFSQNMVFAASRRRGWYRAVTFWNSQKNWVKQIVSSVDVSSEERLILSD